MFLRKLLLSTGLIFCVFCLSACPDFDISDEIPAVVPLETALLVPIDSGILAFPVSNGEISAPVGFLADPGDIADITQRPDGTILCASEDITIDLPEGFVLAPNGDVIQREDGTFLNLDDAAEITEPRAILALSDSSSLVLDALIGRSIARFDADGRLDISINNKGLFTEDLSFVEPVDAVLLGNDVIILDAAQSPRLFRFQEDGTFLGAFVGDKDSQVLINPVGASLGDGNTLFVAESTLNSVFAFNASGELLDFVASEGIGEIADVATVDGGFIVIADKGNEDFGIQAGLRLFDSNGELVQEVFIPELESIANPRVALVRNIEAHPVR